MKKILMCPPNYYDVEYEINPWMNVNNKVDTTNALATYGALKTAFEKNGLTVWEIEPEKGFPDMVYVTNSGYAEDKIFIKANFKHDQRKKESSFAADFFKEKGYEIKTLPSEVIFEGEGDLIRSESKYFLGFGKRTEKSAAEYLQNILNKPVTTLELVDPYYYHLDTCFAPLNDDTVVINPNSFTQESLAEVKRSFSNIIEANEKDNKVLACNLVVANNAVILGKGISDNLQEQIQVSGFKVVQVDMKEYMKGGGSVKCVSLEIYE